MFPNSFLGGQEQGAAIGNMLTAVNILKGRRHVKIKRHNVQLVKASV